MSNLPRTPILGEPLVGTCTAARSLNLPPYWLAQPHERRRRGLPPYRVGKLVRFKLSELAEWMRAQACHAAAGAREEAHAGLQ